MSKDRNKSGECSGNANLLSNLSAVNNADSPSEVEVITGVRNVEEGIEFTKTLTRDKTIGKKLRRLEKLKSIERPQDLTHCDLPYRQVTNSLVINGVATTYSLPPKDELTPTEQLIIIRDWRKKGFDG